MNIDTIPIWITFVVTVISVVLAVRAGFTLGRRVRQKSVEDEKESPAAAMAAAILTLAGFMLTFTFGISFDRLNDRKTLVRDEANAIRTAWLRSDFLPEPDRAEAKGLLRKYVDIRLDVVEADETMRRMTSIRSKKPFASLTESTVRYGTRRSRMRARI